MFRTDLLSVIRSLNTAYTAIGICRASCVDCLLATELASRHSTYEGESIIIRSVHFIFTKTRAEILQLHNIST